MRKLPVICVLIGLLCSCSDNSPNVFVVDIVDPLDGGAAIEMVQISAGTFLMGSDLRPAWVVLIDYSFSPPRVDTVYNYERPVHGVTVDAFKISKTEVTQEQFKSVAGYNPSRFWGFYNLPVENMSWQEAAVFCNKLSGITGLEPCYDLESWECDFSKEGFRLPTEAEWEYACRAGSDLEWIASPNSSGLWYTSWYITDSTFITHTVGSKEPNPAGLYDMTGNVWEWCNDFYRIYNCNSEINPTGPEFGFLRARRGGSWASSAIDCRPAARTSGHPKWGNSVTGFRIVRR